MDKQEKSGCRGMLVVFTHENGTIVGAIFVYHAPVTGDRNTAWLFFAQVQKRNFDEPL